jgi:purine nucleosidase
MAMFLKQRMGSLRNLSIGLLGSLFLCISTQAQQPRLVVIDQDALGPAGTNMNAMLVFLQSPSVRVLGISVLTGDGWRNEEVAHTLRMLELIGRQDIPVYVGAESPLVRTEEWTHAWEKLYGKIPYQGAWSPFRKVHPPLEVPSLPEGNPTTKAAQEDAAHFLIETVHKYPHQVTIYAAGPMTDIAQAISIDPDFAKLAQELVVMGGSISPKTDDKEFTDDPHHEFNFWFDPEAASMTLHAHWVKITATTVDVSVQTRMTEEMLHTIAQSHSPAAQYFTRYSKSNAYLWDELAAAAWLDPALITQEKYVYMDVSLDRGISYGDTETWFDAVKPELDLQKVHAQTGVDWPRLQHFFEQLVMSQTPNAKAPLP